MEVRLLQLSNEQRTSADDFHKNFPFQILLERQSYDLKEIDVALASGYRYIILEAPTGFGKSPVAIVRNLPPSNFAVDDTNFHATIEKMEGGKIMESPV